VGDLGEPIEGVQGQSVRTQGAVNMRSNILPPVMQKSERRAPSAMAFILL
jgi:hypothetical protein